MNNSSLSRTSIVTAGIVAALLAACAAAPVKPDGADSLRTRLIALQSNSELASRVPLALKEADAAVSAAEKPQQDKVIGAHLVFMADRSIAVAQSLAEGRLAVDQSMKGKGVGQLLLMDALHRSLDAAANIAAMAVLVDAKDAAAEAFYRHFSFLPLQQQPRRLFLPMKSIYRLFGN